ncbi:MAG: superoxide dismutase [Lachnospiraceae bacterium]|nr:superoxide dismutase [Lachnospiraceae bacterium]
MFSKETYPFRLPELPYAYHALEPFIDQRTMYFHHDKHLKTYIDNLNKALKAYPEYQTWTLEELLTRLPELPEELRTPVRNNGGGVYNHEMYFHLMAPAGQPFSTEVAEAFGGEDNWKRQMKAAALGQFGSGFAWLVRDTTGALKIIALPNQDNPLTIGLQPILPLDVWEHAYYLKHQNLRSDYIDDWFHVINWNAVEQRLNDTL